MSFLDDVTPIILTLNEDANIERTLSKVRWAREVVVVDSLSTDKTVELLKKESNVRVIQRRFDTHSRQWNFALKETGIATEWILALDADYVLSDELVDELRGLQPPPEVTGYWACFRYCVNGRALRGSLYPPVIALYRRDRATYQQDGHTQRVSLSGPTGRLRSPIFHDDRKSLSRWLSSQDKYTDLEAQKISQTPLRSLAWPDRARKLVVVAPLATLLYFLVLKGGMFQGTAGIYYAAQRVLVETLISLKLLDRALFRRP